MDNRIVDNETLRELHSLRMEIEALNKRVAQLEHSDRSHHGRLGPANQEIYDGIYGK